MNNLTNAGKALNFVTTLTTIDLDRDNIAKSVLKFVSGTTLKTSIVAFATVESALSGVFTALASPFYKRDLFSNLSSRTLSSLNTMKEAANSLRTPFAKRAINLLEPKPTTSSENSNRKYVALAAGIAALAIVGFYYIQSTSVSNEITPRIPTLIELMSNKCPAPEVASKFCEKFICLAPSREGFIDFAYYLR